MTNNMQEYLEGPHLLLYSQDGYMIDMQEYPDAGMIVTKNGKVIHSVTWARGEIRVTGDVAELGRAFVSVGKALTTDGSGVYVDDSDK